MGKINLAKRIKNILAANHLKVSNISVYGTDEYWIWDALTNEKDLDKLYADYIKGKDAELVKDFRENVLHWKLGKKYVINSTECKWEEHKCGDDDWDFPKSELGDILKGDLSDEDCEVYIHFKDSAGEHRYGELTELTIDDARKIFRGKPVLMEEIAKPE